LVNLGINMAKDKSTLGSKLKTGAKAVGGTMLTGGGITLLENLVKAFGGKDGGRVTPRGIGKAKRGFGKAMKRKR
tara:strand:- start:452 stop:676 length:225 start_codon:yes stop_codon:yes gene_type:complete